MKKIEDIDSEFRPNYDFNIPALEQVSNYYSTFQQKIFARVISDEEIVLLREIKRWALERGFYVIILMDEIKLLEVIKLGLSEYEKLHKEDK